MKQEPLDVVIVGAGIVGASAAWQCARRGHHVTLLDQFELGHDRGSSSGDSRIIRRTYADPLYTECMNAAWPMWSQLEDESREQLWHRTGGLFFAKSDSSEFHALRQALTTHNVLHETLDAHHVAARFPALKLRPDELAVFEPDAGYLRASAVVKALTRCAVARGAHYVPHARVNTFMHAHGRIDVQLLDGSHLACDRLIMAAGPWTQPLLAPYFQLPLRVSRQTWSHFAIRSNASTFEREHLPVWIDFSSMHYGFPVSTEMPGVKVARHVAGPTCSPQLVDRTISDADREDLRAYTSQRLPDLDQITLSDRVCLYTNSPDEDFFVGPLPGWPDVTVIAGLSGHGFKFGPLLGQLACDLAEKTTPSLPIHRFALPRFESRAQT